MLLLTTAAVYLLAQALFHRDGPALFAALMFGLMSATVQLAEYLRMYNLLMLACALISLWHVKALSGEKSAGPMRYPALLALTLLGAMTQFYFLFFLLFMAIFYCVVLLVRRQYKALGAYCLTMAVAAGLFFLLYPSVLRQFAGVENSRGGQALAQLSSFSIGSFVRVLADYVQELLRIPFGRSWAGLALLLPAAVALIPAFIHLKGSDRLNLAMLLTASVCLVMVVAQIAPETQVRYISPVIPLLAAVLPGVLCLGLEKLLRHSSALPGLCGGAVCAALLIALWLTPVPTCYRDTLDEPALLKPHQNLNVLCLGERPLWHFTRIRTLPGMMFSTPETLAQADWTALGDSFLVIADYTLDGQQQALAQEAALLSGHESAQHLGELRRRG